MPSDLLVTQEQLVAAINSVLGTELKAPDATATIETFLGDHVYLDDLDAIEIVMELEDGVNGRYFKDGAEEVLADNKQTLAQALDKLNALLER